MLKLYPKFVKNNFSNLVMGNEIWIQFLEHREKAVTKFGSLNLPKDLAKYLVLTAEQ